MLLYAPKNRQLTAFRSRSIPDLLKKRYKKPAMMVKSVNEMQELRWVEGFETVKMHGGRL
jgi:hypothetical protein